MKTITKILKTILGILLLPLCAGAVMALYHVILEIGSVGMVAGAFFSGVVVWILITIFLPKPNTIYVFGHEMTHIFASWIFGGHVKKMKVSADGGHVLVTKSNFLTALAPYFFPFYTVAVMIIFSIGNFFWNWSPYALLFYFLVGLSYAFHITLTFSTLKIKQPDIVEHGYVFSGTVILLCNILILLLGIILFDGKINVSDTFGMWLANSAQIYTYLIHLL